jgi:MFS family permease
MKDGGISSATQRSGRHSEHAGIPKIHRLARPTSRPAGGNVPLISGPTVDERLETLYDLVAEDEDARSCRDLDDSACRWVPRNFFVYLASNTLTKLGDALASPKTVLAWVMATVGAPTAMVALLVPIRESGSMLPQLVLGGWVRQRPLRKPIWMLGSLLQAAAVMGCAASAAWLTGVVAGAAILGCVVIFSLARSLNSLASKDIIGKTIPKGRRGRLNGWASGVSGLFTLGVGIWFAVRQRGEDRPLFYAALLAGAALLWVLATLVFSALQERAGETEGGANGWREAWSRLDLLRTDRAFRRFVVTRALLLCSALTAPFYVVLARENGGGGASLLGTFLVAGGLASSLAAPVWGSAADRSSRLVMMYAALMTAGLGIAMFLLIRSQPELSKASWLFPSFFFGLGVAHAGVRAGRKTYLVDLAGGVKRTDYVALSNTLIGMVLLIVGALTSLASFLEPEELILGLSLLGLCGAGMALTLPEVE